MLFAIWLTLTGAKTGDTIIIRADHVMALRQNKQVCEIVLINDNGSYEVKEECATIIKALTE